MCCTDLEYKVDLVMATLLRSGLDVLQQKMTASLLKLSPLDGEDAAGYMRRRGRVA